MIIYDLCCEQHHQFEGWFKDGDDMQQQIDNGILKCPVCECVNIVKLPAVPKLSKGNKQDVAVINDKQVIAEYEKAQKILGQVHDYLEKNYIDVGNKFADEALKIKKGEKEERNIRGIASPEQVTKLNKEGVLTLPIPPKPVDKQKLN